MNKEDIQRLMGGYATGSLTDEERLKLFEAALDDQELFDALQQEQPLKDLFDDPFSRELVRRAAADSLPQPQTPPRKSWFRQPWIWASATRSEEHTSELQSHLNLVCRLLLEKKKKYPNHESYAPRLSRRAHRITR